MDSPVRGVRRYRLASPSALLALVLVVGASEVRAEPISFFTTVFDTDYVTSALGLRDVGAGDIAVSGVTGTVTRAYLYWHGPTNSTDPAANANVTFNGTGITGANIGFSDDNFWNMQNSQAYRADVTALVTGDGTYSLAGFQSLPNVMINGVGLFVFFDDGDPTNNRDVVLFDGNDSNFASPFDPAGWNLTLPGINYSGGDANLVMYVSDGQDFGPNDDGTLRVNGLPLVSGGIFQGLAPRAPGAGVGNGSLADLRTFDITTFLTLGPNTLNVTLDAGFNDALSLVAAAIDLPAGAAPTQPPPVPEPSVLLLLAAAGGVWVRMRQRPPDA
jgi:hypothetical protein